jgi:hypothetical protein
MNRLLSNSIKCEMIVTTDATEGLGSKTDIIFYPYSVMMIPPQSNAGASFGGKKVCCS